MLPELHFWLLEYHMTCLCKDLKNHSHLHNPSNPIFLSLWSYRPNMLERSCQQAYGHVASALSLHDTLPAVLGNPWHGWEICWYHKGCSCCSWSPQLQGNTWCKNHWVTWGPLLTQCSLEFHQFVPPWNWSDELTRWGLFEQTDFQEPYLCGLHLQNLLQCVWCVGSLDTDLPCFWAHLDTCSLGLDIPLPIWTIQLSIWQNQILSPVTGLPTGQPKSNNHTHMGILNPNWLLLIPQSHHKSRQPFPSLDSRHQPYLTPIGLTQPLVSLAIDMMPTGFLHRVHKRVFWGRKLYRKCNENYKSHWQILYLGKGNENLKFPGIMNDTARKL